MASSSLANLSDCAAIRRRVAQLDPARRPRWGRMTAPEMVCHLADAFRVALGTKPAKPLKGFAPWFAKWYALHTPLPWPHGVPTVPEVEPGKAGTPPARWEQDCAELDGLIEAFAKRRQFARHPLWGTLTESEWLTWGYRHTDHHLRQFGV